MGLFFVLFKPLALCLTNGGTKIAAFSCHHPQLLQSQQQSLICPSALDSEFARSEKSRCHKTPGSQTRQRKRARHRKNDGKTQIVDAYNNGDDDAENWRERFHEPEPLLPRIDLMRSRAFKSDSDFEETEEEDKEDEEEDQQQRPEKFEEEKTKSSLKEQSNEQDMKMQVGIERDENIERILDNRLDGSTSKAAFRQPEDILTHWTDADLRFGLEPGRLGYVAYSLPGPPDQSMNELILGDKYDDEDEEEDELPLSVATSTGFLPTSEEAIDMLDEDDPDFDLNDREGQDIGFEYS
ncbi:unnamed protein product, partial [Protopolystoma xenopodis]